MAKKPAPTLDLSCLDTVSAAEAGAEIELVHPLTRQGLGIFVTVIGMDSQTVRDYRREKADEYLRKQSIARKGSQEEVQTMGKLDDSAIELLTVCTTGWRWGDKVGIFPLAKAGKPVEELAFNVPNVKRIYSELPEARKQLDEAIADRANFIKG